MWGEGESGGGGGVRVVEVGKSGVCGVEKGPP